MFCVTRLFAGGAAARRGGRRVSAAAALSSSPASAERPKPERQKSSDRIKSSERLKPERQKSSERPNSSEWQKSPEAPKTLEGPKLYGKRTESEVLQLAQRMQQRDLTGEVPVASFAFEVLKAHPSVRQMAMRERMAFLCDRWERLGKRERQAYLDDPLRGLL